MCKGRPIASAATTKSPSAAADGASRRRCATHAAATSAASGGTASAASARWAVCKDNAPETTASAAAAEAPTAISRSQGPGLTSDTNGRLLLQPAPQVSKRPCAGHVGNLVEVIRRRRRARVPLERVRHPGVVSGAPADPGRPHDVDQKDEGAERHHEGADRRNQVPGRPPAVVVVGPDAPRHTQQAEEVLREEGQVDPDEVEPEVDLPKTLVEESSEHLRPPVVEGREEGKRGAAEEH